MSPSKGRCSGARRLAKLCPVLWVLGLTLAATAAGAALYFCNGPRAGLRVRVRGIAHDAAGMALKQWVEDHGGYAHIVVTAVGPGGLRGVVADRDLAKGEAVAVVPATCWLDLGPLDRADGSQVHVAEQAGVLLRRRAALPAWDIAMAPYWAALPGSGAVFTRFSAAWAGSEGTTLRALLDDASGAPGPLAALIEADQAIVRDVYANLTMPAAVGGPPDGQPPLEGLALEDFQHWVSLIHSYEFQTFGDVHPVRGEKGIQLMQDRSPVLLPLLDLINHAPGGNVVIGRDVSTGAFAAQASQNIAAGQEVTLEYPEAARPDQALLNYGFLPHSAEALLSVADLPPPDGLGSPYSEADHGIGGRLATAAEAARLEALLAQLPTVAQDAALARRAGPTTASWREALVVRYRVGRRRAVETALKRVRAALAAPRAA